MRERETVSEGRARERESREIVLFWGGEIERINEKRDVGVLLEIIGL